MHGDGSREYKEHPHLCPAGTQSDHMGAKFHPPILHHDSFAVKSVPPNSWHAFTETPKRSEFHSASQSHRHTSPNSSRTPPGSGIEHESSQGSPAVVHDGPQQVVDLGRTPLEAVVHVYVILVVIFERLHYVLEIRVLPRSPDQRALTHPASGAAKRSHPESFHERYHTIRRIISTDSRRYTISR